MQPKLFHWVMYIDLIIRVVEEEFFNVKVEEITTRQTYFHISQVTHYKSGLQAARRKGQRKRLKSL